MGIVLLIIGARAVLSTVAIPATEFLQESMSRQSSATHRQPFTRFMPESARPVVLCGSVGRFSILAGIASIQVQRWVRPMVLAISWPWLAWGSCVLVGVTISARHSSEIGALIWICRMHILMPALLLWFYVKPEVDGTLRYFDLRPSWTDRKPLPVIGISVWLVGLSVWQIAEVLSPAVPVFGTILFGHPARALLLTVSIMLLFLARGADRQRPLGWRDTVITLALMIASLAITRTTPSTIDDMRRAGYSEDALLAESRSLGSSGNIEMFETMIPLALGTLYIIRIRRLFTNNL